MMIQFLDGGEEFRWEITLLISRIWNGLQIICSKLLFSRIWGEQGQAALEKASICLLNCGPTGSETLKNLVLGGIGSIAVVDGSKVEVGDLGNNFMGIIHILSWRVISILHNFWFCIFFWGHVCIRKGVSLLI